MHKNSGVTILLFINGFFFGSKVFALKFLFLVPKLSTKSLSVFIFIQLWLRTSVSLVTLKCIDTVMINVTLNKLELRSSLGLKGSVREK